MLISLHLPKTAGSSFRKALHDFHGDKIVTYNDFIEHQIKYNRNKRALKEAIRGGNLFKVRLNKLLKRKNTHIECIHGHFLPIKYLLLSCKYDITFVTWLREPVARLISQYYFWKNTKPSKKAKLHYRVINENWSLLKFCFSNEIKNLYSQYLWGFPLEYFSFIGITEHYKQDLDWFARTFLNTKLNVYTKNVRKISFNPYDEISHKLQLKIEDFHQTDVIIYKKALQLRENRISIK